MAYIKKCKELKQVVEKEQRQPADAARIEAGHALIKSLSTQLKISLRVADTISDRIIKLMDEELWTCFCQLMHGWLEMWRVNTECHRRQGQAIAEVTAEESRQKQLAAGAATRSYADCLKGPLWT
ncbi:hypothetical protein MLD38_002169 [Melastoma candidum]|uniref:Uncharacterized protein n=1 Tax=Melastoma candidum TaxID=119954 RepID=A0ACB9SFM7_9MYRT|nr:hypothetical protein MLD38_002169 [Melastoma candidum]